MEAEGLRVHVDQACPGTAVVDTSPPPGTTVRRERTSSPLFVLLTPAFFSFGTL